MDSCCIVAVDAGRAIDARLDDACLGDARLGDAHLCNNFV